MSNGGGSGGGRAQELRSGDLWGRQLISERRTFIFLEAENSPMETNSTVWICGCRSVCVFIRRPGVPCQERVGTWTRAGMNVSPCCHEACMWRVWFWWLPCARFVKLCVYTPVYTCLCVCPSYCAFQAGCACLCWIHRPHTCTPLCVRGLYLLFSRTACP